MSATLDNFVLAQQQLSSVKNRLDRRISAVLDYLLAQDLTTVPSVHSIAILLNLSQSRLRSIFREHAGMPLSRYIKLLRLCQGRMLLQETMLTVKEVMAQVGLADHSHFSRDYKKQFGESPSDTRNRAVHLRLVRSFSPHNS